MPDVVITPATGKIEFKPAGTTVTTIDAAANTLHVTNLSSATQTIFNVEGTNGSLFSVVDTLDGTLMSVNNNAGLPVFEVFSDDSIIAGRYAQNDFIITTAGRVGLGTATPDAEHKLTVVGGAAISANELGNALTVRAGPVLCGDIDDTVTSPSATIFAAGIGGGDIKLVGTYVAAVASTGDLLLFGDVVSVFNSNMVQAVGNRTTVLNCVETKITSSQSTAINAAQSQIGAELNYDYSDYEDYVVNGIRYIDTIYFDDDYWRTSTTNINHFAPGDLVHVIVTNAQSAHPYYSTVELADVVVDSENNTTILYLDPAVFAGPQAGSIDSLVVGRADFAANSVVIGAACRARQPYSLNFASGAQNGRAGYGQSTKTILRVITDSSALMPLSTPAPIYIPQNSSVFFNAKIVAFGSIHPNVRSAAFYIRGLVTRDVQLTTEIVGTPDTTSWKSTLMSATSVTVSSAAETLVFSVTGLASTTIHWVCEVDLTTLTLNTTGS